MIAQHGGQAAVTLHRQTKKSNTMNKNIWTLIEIFCYIFKMLIDHYDTRTEKPQPTEHTQE